MYVMSPRSLTEADNLPRSREWLRCQECHDLLPWCVGMTSSLVLKPDIIFEKDVYQ
jgi:hypothetical protein